MSGKRLGKIYTHKTNNSSDYSGSVCQEAIVRTRHGTPDWFRIGKGAHQDCMLSPVLFNLYAEYIIRDDRLDEITSWNQDCWEKHQQPHLCRWYHSNAWKQRGTKEFLDESEEESGKVGLKLNIKKSKGLPLWWVAKTPCSQCMGPGFNPWSGN